MTGSTRLFCWFTTLCVLSAMPSFFGCIHADADGGGHEHSEGHVHDSEEPEAASLAITRWTDRYELFVELPAPVAGKPVPYHAHVTQLSDFRAVTAGHFLVRFKTADGVAAQAQIEGVKRPGIFVFEGPAPPQGSYSLEMTYQHAGTEDVFDCGPVTVTSEPLPAPPEGPDGTLTFLKESQWKVPFGTAWAEERALARELELPATVEPASGDQLTIGAPTGGRFFHSPKLPLAEGRKITRGDVVGSIVPNIAGDDYSRLLLAGDETRVERERVLREIERVEPLVKQGLLPERRLLDLRSELDLASARSRSAQDRLARVSASGGVGGLPIRSTLTGLIGQVLVPNGEPVEAGAALLRIGGTASVWLRARFVAKPEATTAGAAPVAVRLPTGERIELTSTDSRLLSPSPVVDPTSRIATWLVEVSTSASKNLHAGASVVLILRVGEPHSTVAVPRDAVLDINTRPFVFVQVDGEHFAKRAVTQGDEDGGFVAITEGVSKGERVVTRGAFDIHLAALMGTVESHRH